MWQDVHAPKGYVSAARLAQSDRASDSYDKASASEGCEFDPRGGLLRRLFAPDDANGNDERSPLIHYIT